MPNNRHETAIIARTNGRRGAWLVGALALLPDVEARLLRYNHIWIAHLLILRLNTHRATPRLLRMIWLVTWLGSWMLLFFLVLLLALLNVICYVPMLGAVLMKIQAFHRRVSSDIPGNPHMFDACIISMMRTLPEPSNFNLIWTNVPFAEPLILRGTFCKSRFNSLSIYGSNMCDPPNSLDLADINANPDGSFELTISRDPTAESSNNICSNDWAGGFISMRNYLVPPGTGIATLDPP